MSHPPRFRPWFPALAASALLAGLTGAGLSGPALAAAHPDAAAAGGTRLVELPTGTQVRLAGSTALVTGTNSGLGGVFQTVSLAGDEYVIPAAAESRGRVIDPSLFDVTHPVLTSGRARVTVTFAAGVRPHAVPGIATTSVSGRTLRGTITASSARAFGAALTGQPGGSGATAPALAGVSRIAPVLAGQAGPTRHGPQYQMETLTINVTLPPAMTSGAAPEVVIADVDGPNRYSKLITGVSGPFALSVPKGHYAIFASEFGVANRTATAEWFSGRPQFTVSHDSSVTVPLSKAVTPVTAATPKPAAEIGGAASIIRNGLGGSGLGIGVSNATGQPLPMYVAPTGAAPTIGTLDYDFGMRLAAPSSATVPYYYDLDFSGQGSVPADHSYRVSGSSLATIHDRFGSVDAAFECVYAGHPWGLPLGGSCPGLATPVSDNDYVTADPQVHWSTSATGYGTEITPTVVIGGRDAEFPNSDFRAFTPGEQVNESWFSQPDAPNLLGLTGEAIRNADGSLTFGQTICSACASGSALSLLLNPRGTASGWGALDAADSASYQISADGTVVQSGDLTASAGQLDTTVQMPAAQTYGIELDTSRDPSANPLSTSTQTIWQVPAAARQALPAGWECTASGGTGCAVVPLLDALTNLPTSDSGTLPSGQVTGSIDVSQLGGTAAAVKSVRLQVSYDGGTTWQAAGLTPEGNGRYRARLAVPATPGSTGGLRVTVTGSSGATFTQTIDNAFAVASS